MERILIIGASGGLGQSLCQTFAKDQPHIGVHYFKHRSEGERLVDQLGIRNCKASLFSADIRDSGAVQKMFRNLWDDWGGIDLLINSAGIAQNRLLQQLPSSDWHDQIQLNLTGVFYCMREASRIMEKQGKGHILNIASHAAFTGPMGQAAYAASKRGLIALSQTAAREWGKNGIQVNAVCPGFLPTPMTSTLSGQQSQRLIKENVLGRPSSLEEVSEFIRTLSKMRHVSGQVFYLDSRIS